MDSPGTDSGAPLLNARDLNNFLRNFSHPLAQSRPGICITGHGYLCHFQA